MKKSILRLILLLAVIAISLTSCELLKDGILGENPELKDEVYDKIYEEAAQYGYEGTPEELKTRIDESLKRYAKEGVEVVSYRIDTEGGNLLYVQLSDGSEIYCGSINEDYSASVDESSAVNMEICQKIYDEAINMGFKNSVEYIRAQIDRALQNNGIKDMKVVDYRIDRELGDVLFVSLSDGKEINCGSIHNPYNDGSHGDGKEEYPMTITFDSRGGSECDPITYKVSTAGEISEFPVPVREGYSFLGWYKTTDFFETPVEITAQNIREAQYYSGILCARWKKDFVDDGTRGADIVSGTFFFFPFESYGRVPLLMCNGSSVTKFYFDEKLTSASVSISGGASVSDVKFENTSNQPEAVSTVFCNFTIPTEGLYTVTITVTDEDGNTSVIERMLEVYDGNSRPLPYSFPELVGTALKNIGDESKPESFSSERPTLTRGYKYKLYFAFSGDFDTFEVTYKGEKLDYYIENDLYIVSIEYTGIYDYWTIDLEATKDLFGTNYKWTYVNNINIGEEEAGMKIIDIQTSNPRESYSDGVLNIFAGVDRTVRIFLSVNVTSAYILSNNLGISGNMDSDGVIQFYLPSMAAGRSEKIEIWLENKYEKPSTVSFTITSGYDYSNPDPYELEDIKFVVLGVGAWEKSIDGKNITIIENYDGYEIVRDQLYIAFRYKGYESPRPITGYVDGVKIGAYVITKDSTLATEPPHTYCITSPALAVGNHTLKIELDNGFVDEYVITVAKKVIPDVDNMGAMSPDFSFDKDSVTGLYDIGRVMGAESFLSIYYHKDYVITGIHTPAICWDLSPEYNVPVEGTDLHETVFSLEDPLEVTIFIIIYYRKYIDGYYGKEQSVTFNLEMNRPPSSETFYGVFYKDESQTEYVHHDSSWQSLTVGLEYDFVFSKEVKEVNVWLGNEWHTPTKRVVNGYYIYTLDLSETKYQNGDDVEVRVTYVIADTNEDEAIEFMISIRA